MMLDIGSSERMERKLVESEIEIALIIASNIKSIVDTIY